MLIKKKRKKREGCKESTRTGRMRDRVEEVKIILK
jgi:hypothetical protein